MIFAKMEGIFAKMEGIFAKMEGIFVGYPSKWQVETHGAVKP
jgi:hypothetical protein